MEPLEIVDDLDTTSLYIHVPAPASSPCIPRTSLTVYYTPAHVLSTLLTVYYMSACVTRKLADGSGFVGRVRTAVAGAVEVAIVG